MLIVIGGEKGGTGKSCLTQNIAVILQKKIDPDILIVDCDPQKTTSFWVQRRERKIQCIQMYGEIFDKLQALKRQYKTIIIDCAGNDSKAFRSALSLCTHALFPIRAKSRDLQTIFHLKELLDEVKKTNRFMHYAMVINQAPALPSQYNRILNAKEFCRDSGIPCLNSIIFNRNIFDDSEEVALSVEEMDVDPKAKQELYELIEEFLDVKF